MQRLTPFSQALMAASNLKVKLESQKPKASVAHFHGFV
jgi:hypothetical protein